MTARTETKAPSDISGWYRAVPYAAPALVLLAVVVPFLRFNEYSLLMPESLILLGGAVVIGASIGTVGQLRPRTLAPMMMALTLGYYLFYRQDVMDFLVEAARVIGDVVATPGVALASLAVAMFLALCLACVLMRRHLDMIVAAIFGTMVLSTLVLPTDIGGEPVQTGALPQALKPLPPVIHIILDEHIGLSGLPQGLAESDKARRAIESTYKDFALHSHAYSRFAETKFSFTSLMNGDVGTDVSDLIESSTYKFVLKENRWFDLLKAKGYAIKVYESAWYEMCGPSAPVDACYSYSFFSPNAIQRTGLPLEARLRALAQKLFIGRNALQMEPLVATEALMRFRSDVAANPRGVAYIVHLVLPHFGYLYGDDCMLLDPSEWQREAYGDDERYSASERQDLYRRYLNQVVCTEKQMDDLFAQLKTIGVYDEATIIVHGDHGSRIAERPYIIAHPEMLTPQDLLDHYATLLAIKAPGIKPGMNDAPVALQAIFAETFLGGAIETAPPPNTVFMRVDEHDNFRPVELVWPADSAPVASLPAASVLDLAEIEQALPELRR
jgi:hypothetical protein